jgi:hypothetical protein
MFVRFRQAKSGHLHVSIVEPRRINGTVKQEHVASLGSIMTPPTVDAREVLWVKLEERLPRLANRLGEDGMAKVRAAVQERIPRPTDFERMATKALDDWNRLRGDYEGLIQQENEMVAFLKESIVNKHAFAREMNVVLDDVADTHRKVQLRLARGDLDVIEEASPLYDELTRIFLKVVAAKTNWREDDDEEIVLSRLI